MKIGILGGSFDPIHQGHLTLAREAGKQFRLDKILFLPALHPPHKKASVSTPAPHRARMVELAIMGEPHWELCDLELRRPGISYTVDTLRELVKIYPSPHKLFFIAGADSLVDFKDWKNPEVILKLAEWIVAGRPSIKLPDPLPARIHSLHMPLIKISSSEIRQKAKRGEDISGEVSTKVRAYIERMKIYQEKIR